ncbi:MAG: glycosyltransferase family 2 protein [Actinomycetota bacterium]|nr:glycosyltransferase family 2 protein [Actinomycetota bacterium]
MATDEFVLMEGPTTGARVRIDVVMPAHNEGATIGQTIREFHRSASEMGSIEARFVVAEDGSTDDTCEVVRAVAAEVPIRLLTSPDRKGYSRAVVDGIWETSAALVCVVDSDGQCDPADLPAFVEALSGRDVVVGYRNPRIDPWFRRFISGAFKLVYQRLFPVRLRDPSCPYVLLRRDAVAPLFRGNPGLLRQGFWWEFNARAIAARLIVGEVPVNHRVRTAGTTRVYKMNKIPGIAFEHLRALFVLRRELRALPPVPQPG